MVVRVWFVKQSEKTNDEMKYTNQSIKKSRLFDIVAHFSFQNSNIRTVLKNIPGVKLQFWMNVFKHFSPKLQYSILAFILN